MRCAWLRAPSRFSRCSATRGPRRATALASPGVATPNATGTAPSDDLRGMPGLMLATLLGITSWRIARKNNYPRLPKASWTARLKSLPRCLLGALADRHCHRRHHWRHFHAHGGGGDERCLRLRHCGVRLSRLEPQGSTRRAAHLSQLECNAALYHHQRGVVLLPDDA